jgi:hypothetical protein
MVHEIALFSASAQHGNPQLQQRSQQSPQLLKPTIKYGPDAKTSFCC